MDIMELFKKLVGYAVAIVISGLIVIWAINFLTQPRCNTNIDGENVMWETMYSMKCPQDQTIYNYNVNQ